MRFMGNKESMLGDIEKLLRDKGLLAQSLIFLMLSQGPALFRII